MAQLAELVKVKPIVTVIGVPGCGKSRFALEFARSVLEPFDGAVVWVSLTSVSSSTLVSQSVASAFGIREPRQQSVTQAIADQLLDKPCLLVIDNCSHHKRAVGVLAAALTQAVQKLRILVTSRAVLGIVGETVFPLLPLAAPPRDVLDAAASEPAHVGVGADQPSSNSDVARLQSWPAVEFFVDRARIADPGFELTPGNAPDVCTVVRRLDGLPLALELAAARLRGLSVRNLHACLDDCFTLLTSGDCSAATHHQTLAMALDWSYNELSPAHQELFRRLSVFAGGFTLDAAQAIASPPRDASAHAQVTLGAVAARLCELVDQSLVIYDGNPVEPRYSLPGLLAQYGRERLADAGETPTVMQRHSQYYLALVEHIAAGGDAPLAAAQLDRLEAERDNLRLALDTFVRAGDGEGALRLACSLKGFWEARTYLTEGRRCLDAALEAGRDGPPLLRARALEAKGILAHIASEHGLATQCHREALALRQQAEDKRGAAASFLALAILAKDQAEYAEAEQCYAQSLALFQELGDRARLADLFANMGVLTHVQGDYLLSTQRFQESLALYREMGDTRGTAYALSNLGLAARNQGNYAWAAELHSEALALRQAIGDRLGIAYSLANLGLLAQNQEQLDEAIALQTESLALFRELGHQAGVALLLSTLAQTVLYQNDLARAATAATESLAVYQALSHKWGIATALLALAQVAFGQGDEERARAQVTESLVLRRDLDDRHGIAECIEVMAWMEADHNRARADVLVALADELRRLIPAPRAPVESAYLSQRLGPLQPRDEEAVRFVRRAKAAGEAFKSAVDFVLHGPSGEAQAAAPDGLGEQALRQALHHLNDPAFLQRSLFAHHVSEMTGARLTGRAVQALLLQAIEGLKPTKRRAGQERRELYYKVLRARFVDEEAVHDLTQRLGLSERQYYRELASAICALLDVILEECA